MESIIPFSCQALCFVEPEACVIHLHCPSDVSFCVIGRATILAFSVEYLVQRCLTPSCSLVATLNICFKNQFNHQISWIQKSDI